MRGGGYVNIGVQEIFYWEQTDSLMEATWLYRNEGEGSRFRFCLNSFWIYSCRRSLVWIGLLGETMRVLKFGL